jgi:glutathione S-transferase
MKILLRVLLVGVACLCLVSTRWLMQHHAGQRLAEVAPVNAVVGDTSYVARFGEAPTAATPDFVRIQTHLAYAEQQLRQRTPAGLPATQRQRRAQLLDLLHSYWQAGVFPRNEAPDGQRHPCFIDGAGRICAVGYLVEQTAGRAAAERINQRFQYQELPAMRDAALSRWVVGSGLSLADCALIQPSYNFQPAPETLTNGYATSSALLGGANLAAIALNRSAAGQQTGRWLPLLTMATGTTQAIVGLGNFPSEDSYYSSSSDARRYVSIANVGVGTATLLFGTWNLLHRNTTSQLPRTSFNVGPSPVGSGLRAEGTSVFITRRF